MFLMKLIGVMLASVEIVGGTISQIEALKLGILKKGGHDLRVSEEDVINKYNFAIANPTELSAVNDPYKLTLFIVFCNLSNRTARRSDLKHVCGSIEGDAAIEGAIDVVKKLRYKAHYLKGDAYVVTSTLVNPFGGGKVSFPDTSVETVVGNDVSVTTSSLSTGTSLSVAPSRQPSTDSNPLQGGNGLIEQANTQRPILKQEPTGPLGSLVDVGSTEGPLPPGQFLEEGNSVVTTIDVGHGPPADPLVKVIPEGYTTHSSGSSSEDAMLWKTPIVQNSQDLRLNHLSFLLNPRYKPKYAPSEEELNNLSKNVVANMWETLKLDGFRVPEGNTGPLIYAVLQLRNLYGTNLDLGEGSVGADGEFTKETRDKLCNEKNWKEKGSSLSSFKHWIGCQTVTTGGQNLVEHAVEELGGDPRNFEGRIQVLRSRFGKNLSPPEDGLKVTKPEFLEKYLELKNPNKQINLAQIPNNIAYLVVKFAGFTNFEKYFEEGGELREDRKKELCPLPYVNDIDKAWIGGCPPRK